VTSPSPIDRLVGFVGIGAMGQPMVGRLSAAGFQVHVYDLDPRRAELVGQLPGVVRASSLGDLGATPVVICMLPSSNAVRQVATMPGGLFDCMGKGSLIIDMGSSEPAQTAELGRLAAAAGLALADAPVSGGVARARTGELTIMFGGADDLLERSRHILDAMGSNLMHVGPLSSGHALKALNNLLSAVGLAAATEVMEVGRRYGLDPNTMLDVINHSTGRNHATETKVAQFVLSETYASGFGLRLMLKDVKTAIDLARSLDVDCPIGEACLELWGEAARRLPADADQTLIALMAAGVQKPAAAEKAG
jgi:3-hydroxyisobutyrate dehydrogenase